MEIIILTLSYTPVLSKHTMPYFLDFFKTTRPRAYVASPLEASLASTVNYINPEYFTLAAIDRKL